MAEGSGSLKVNPNLVAEIVSSYVAKNSVPVDQVGGLTCCDTSDAERAR